MSGWKKKRILLYAHGGLVDEAPAVQRIADYRSRFMAQEIYPLSFIWHTGFWSSISNIIMDAIRQRRPEGQLDDTKDFMLDRLDDALEPLVRTLTGKAIWDEIKENAVLASRKKHGARIVLDQLADLITKQNIEVHLACHSAGSIFLAPLARLLTSKGRISSGYLKGDTGYGLSIKSVSLWAPACTVDLFKQTYLPAIQDRSINRFGLYVLSDKAEQDDNCAHIYNKSLLYLVSNALEDRVHIHGVLDGTPLLGLEKFINADQEIKRLFRQARAQLIVSLNNEAEGSLMGSGSHHHGDFDDDDQTVNATLARILGVQTVSQIRTATQQTFHHSSSAFHDRRKQIEQSS